MADPVTALSDNVLDLTVTRLGAAVNNAVVTVTIYGPSGGITLVATNVPFVSNGLYELNTGPVVWPTDGNYRSVWDVTDSNGRKKHKEESVVCVR